MAESVREAKNVQTECIMKLLPARPCDLLAVIEDVTHMVGGAVMFPHGTPPFYPWHMVISSKGGGGVFHCEPWG